MFVIMDLLWKLKPNIAKADTLLRSSGYYCKIVPEEAGASRAERGSASQRRGSHSRNSTIVSAFVSSSSVFTASSRDVSDGREGRGGSMTVCMYTAVTVHNHHACKYHV